MYSYEKKQLSQEATNLSEQVILLEKKAKEKTKASSLKGEA